MKKSLTIGAAALAAGLSASAFAGSSVEPLILEIDLSGLHSVDGLGSEFNAVVEQAMPAGYDTIIGVGWDVTLETIGASWASESTFAIGDMGAEAGLFITPGAGEDAPLGAPTNYLSDFDEDGIADILDLSDNGITDITVASGVASIELFESFDDVTGEADAVWAAGSVLMLQVVPAPGAMALIGVAGLMGTRRRRA